MSWAFWVPTLGYAAAITAVILGALSGRGWRIRGFVLLLTLAGLVTIWLLGERTLFWF